MDARDFDCTSIGASFGQFVLNPIHAIDEERPRSRWGCEEITDSHFGANKILHFFRV